MCDFVSFATIWARLYQRCSLVARDSVLRRWRKNKSFHDWIMSSIKKGYFCMNTNFEGWTFWAIFSFAFFRLKASDDGKKALVKLANGDMRKVLNVLQSTWMAYKDITEETVYLCVGHPTPNDIKTIINWLMSVESFQECYESEEQLKYLQWIDSLLLIFNWILFCRNPRTENNQGLSIGRHSAWGAPLRDAK